MACDHALYHLLDQTGFTAFEAASGAVTLIQIFGSAANLNIHLHCLVLDGVYRHTDGEPVLINAAGQVLRKLETTWCDGTTHIVMSPLEFMQRLAARATEGHL